MTAPQFERQPAHGGDGEVRSVADLSSAWMSVSHVWPCAIYGTLMHKRSTATHVWQLGVRLIED